MRSFCKFSPVPTGAGENEVDSRVCKRASGPVLRGFKEIDSSYYAAAAPQAPRRSNFDAGWGFCEPALFEDGLAPQVGGDHLSAQRLADVRRDAMTRVEILCGHFQRGIGVEDEQVRVIAICEAALLTLQLCQSRGFLRHQACHILQFEAALFEACPHDWERDREASDSSPGSVEATLF